MYKVSIPSPPLRTYVSRFWEGELHMQAGQEHVHQAIASSKTEWLFCYAGSYAMESGNGSAVTMPRAGCFGQGALSQQYISNSRRYGFFGIRLYPHTLPLLFNIPAAAITSRQLDLTALLGKPGAGLADRLFNASSFEERVALAAAFLESRLPHKRNSYARFEKLIYSVYQHQHPFSIHALAGQANLSPRQFERHFKDLTGFPAKTFFKITRFEALLDRLCIAGGAERRSLTAIAHDLGYYDQAHLNRHFREFTGMSPLAYLRYAARV